MNKHTYKALADNSNPFDIVIEKGNVDVTFTLRDMHNEQNQLRELITKWRGQRNLEAQKIENIEQHHPFILEMSEQDLFTAHMYQESKAMVVGIESRLPDLEKQLAESIEEEEEIIERLGIDTKQAVVAEAVEAIVNPPKRSRRKK